MNKPQAHRLRVKPGGTLSISRHALIRYMERVQGFDFTNLRVDYMVENGLPSLNYGNDGPFVDWVAENLNLNEFYGWMKSEFHKAPEEQRMATVECPDYVVRVYSPNCTFVVHDGSVITTLVDE